MCLDRADEVPDPGGADQYLTAGDPTGPLLVHQELLSDDTLEGCRQHHPDLLLLRRGEHVDDPVDGLRGILGMEGGEHQVTGLRRRQCRRNGLEVTELPHQNDIGVLTQYPTKGLGE